MRQDEDDELDDAGEDAGSLGRPLQPLETLLTRAANDDSTLDASSWVDEAYARRSAPNKAWRFQQPRGHASAGLGVTSPDAEPEVTFTI